LKVVYVVEEEPWTRTEPWGTSESTLTASEKWSMKLHPDKCTVLRVTNKKKTIDAKYQLHGHKLESVTSAKYLGLAFTNKLQWDQHIHYITSKANKKLLAFCVET
jgi:hypothetical protein